MAIFRFRPVEGSTVDLQKDFPSRSGTAEVRFANFTRPASPNSLIFAREKLCVCK